MDKKVVLVFPGLEVCGKIGDGSLGPVYLARDKTEGTLFAVKVIRNINYHETSSTVALNKLRTESAITSHISHANILKLYAIDFYRYYSFLKLEYAPGGDLLKFIRETPVGQVATIEKARRLIRQLASVVNFCHSKVIAHRTLEPSNILISYGGNIKIYDCSMATKLVRQRQKDNDSQKTIGYIPPEMYTRGARHTAKVDVFAFGVILFMITTGQHPYGTENELMGIKDYELIVGRIKNRNYKLPDHFDDQLKYIIRGSLEPDPESRLSIEEFLAHAWLK